MILHRLKIETNYLNNLISGTKKVEIRFNDRDYQKGDVLEFCDYSKLNPEYHFFQITHIHSGLGMERNYVCLSVQKTDSPKWA